MSQRPLRIGLSACFFHADPRRPIFTGKTLLYLEESMAHWLLAAGALVYMLPSVPRGVRLAALLEQVDGLLLQAGADIAPSSYGESALRPEWEGDAVRDAYEIELLRECMERDKPVLGVCRGMQLINVALGGSMFQDIATQRSEALRHRDPDAYDQHFHTLTFVPHTRLSRLYAGRAGGRVNSVHHQAVKALGGGLTVEARSADDGIVEALRLAGDRYVFGVQWHPEFHDASDASLLPSAPLLNDFLAAIHERRQAC
ncbi:MAG TPA: type 1 glutamine amidotransferase [Myxococcota bacterium]|nr:type 1 glutamine amidotransferase [Myxococcota bacterium]